MVGRIVAVAAVIVIRIEIASNNQTDTLILFGLLHQLHDFLVRGTDRWMAVDLDDLVALSKTSIDVGRWIGNNATHRHLRFFFFATHDSQSEAITSNKQLRNDRPI